MERRLSPLLVSMLCIGIAILYIPILVLIGYSFNASALVSVAVRHLLATREDLGYSRDQVDAMLGDAVASLERGEGNDGEEFFAKLEREDPQPLNQRG